MRRCTALHACCSSPGALLHRRVANRRDSSTAGQAKRTRGSCTPLVLHPRVVERRLGPRAPGQRAAARRTGLGPYPAHLRVERRAASPGRRTPRTTGSARPRLAPRRPAARRAPRRGSCCRCRAPRPPGRRWPTCAAAALCCCRRAATAGPPRTPRRPRAGPGRCARRRRRSAAPGPSPSPRACPTGPAARAGGGAMSDGGCGERVFNWRPLKHQHLLAAAAPSPPFGAPLSRGRGGVDRGARQPPQRHFEVKLRVGAPPPGPK